MKSVEGFNVLTVETMKITVSLEMSRDLEGIY
jgi:hypothetical protein